MSDEQVNNVGRHIWAYRIAIFWFLLFSVNSLCTAIVVALTGAKWQLLTSQEKFLIVVAITGNWTGTIMAYVSKNAKRVDAGELPELGNGSGGPGSGGTGFLEKVNVK